MNERGEGGKEGRIGQARPDQTRSRVPPKKRERASERHGAWWE